MSQSETQSKPISETEASGKDPRKKRDWIGIVERSFGPDAELVRTSSYDRDGRFVIAKTIKSVFGGSRSDVAVLGSGDSWPSAYERALTSDLGMAAIADNKRAIELAKVATQSKSPEEFADKVMQISIDEAVASGATEQEINELKSKFTEARKAINANDDKPAEQ